MHKSRLPRRDDALTLKGFTIATSFEIQQFVYSLSRHPHKGINAGSPEIGYVPSKVEYYKGCLALNSEANDKRTCRMAKT